MATEITSSDILTPEQLNFHSKIYAGPGAGKTHFLVKNVKNIISTNPLITKSRERKVLCITYTNAAVDEIKRRLNKYTIAVEAYTIHGFIFEHIIKPFQEDLKALMELDFDIKVETRKIISSQVEGLGLLHGVDKEEIFEFIKCPDADYSKNSMGKIEVDNKSFIENNNKELTCPSQNINTKHIKPIKEYIWSKARKLTHNEILYFGYRILEKNPLALYSLRVKFPFIFVDEFQDTNPLQTLIIKLIGKKNSTIFVVGDIAQSIYSFQGAKPDDFKNFSIENEIKEYVIQGNRRSNDNIVNFCNFLRQSDENVIQKSIKEYSNEEEKEKSKNQKIYFLMGESQNVKNKIKDILNQGGVVLTRTWAAAFEYIQDINPEQAKTLKNIYSSYYNTPIDIRNEIIELNNVDWVKAFRFIFRLFESYKKGCFNDLLGALKIYCDNINPKKLTTGVLFKLRKLCANIFENIKDEDYTTKIIEKFNNEIKKEEFSCLTKTIFQSDFSVEIFNEYDNEKLQIALNNLHWITSYKLFDEVFTSNSKYMTVHQAKGLEWEKVIVSVNPTRNDKSNIKDLYSKPKLTDETPQDEFTRIYYVASSRAKEELYIHITSMDESEISKDMDGYSIAYEFIN